MGISAYKENIQDYAKDIRINLGSVLSEEGAPGLTQNQIAGVALTATYFIQDKKLSEAVLDEFQSILSDEEIIAAKSAASIMSMNTTYYRSIHLLEDGQLSQMPAKLRMTVIGKPGVEKVDFELYSLSAAALAGCGMCLKSHVAILKKSGVSDEGIQSVLRISAVINAAKTTVAIG